MCILHDDFFPKFMSPKLGVRVIHKRVLYPNNYGEFAPKEFTLIKIFRNMKKHNNFKSIQILFLLIFQSLIVMKKKS